MVKQPVKRIIKILVFRKTEFEFFSATHFVNILLYRKKHLSLGAQIYLQTVKVPKCDREIALF